MKIKQITENTTSGSIATTDTALGGTQRRGNPSIYGGKKVGSLFKGKKTKAPYANSINESAELSEAQLEEDDIIVVPGQGRSRKNGFVPHGKSRVDHEVEMARSDLFSAAKNAKKVYEMIQDVSEEEGLDGWVQEKIIKANDYLNTIREYLEGKQVQGVNEGMPADNDMGSTTSGAKMTLGQWKQMWMKKMPNADFAAMFRSPPNMRGSAIAYFDGWMNNPDARWDPQQGVAEEKCPHCGGEMVNEELMNEKKDACYYKVKSRYKVWPSAYASGALVKCRNKGAKNWGNGGKKNESSILEGIEQADESLHDWFNKEKWVRMDTKGKIKGPCAREPGEGKPKCLPQSKAHSLGKKGRASAAQRKRREDPNPERSGKAINVNTKKKD